MEKLRFREFFLQAWAAATPRKLPWIFGSVIAVSGILESRLGIGTVSVSSSREFVGSIAAQDPQTMLLSALAFLALAIVGIFGRGNLIVTLAFVTGKTGLPDHPDTASAIGRNFWRALQVECIAFLALLATIGTLSIPLLIASSHNPGALGTLISLSILTFVIIAIAVFLIRQFALFYFLLSPVRIRAAIELGSSLFYRFIVQSLLFGLFSLALTVLFTFCMNIVILGIAVLFGRASIPVPETYISLTIGFASFAWFAVFQQALWLSFFKSVASQQETEKQAEETASAPVGDNLPETPPAQ